MVKRIVLGITGASGAIYGVRTLEALRAAQVETHLVVSHSGLGVLGHETDRSLEDLEALADFRYDPGDLYAPIASGSFRCSGMLIAPCSMKTLGAIASGYGDNLIVRSADVALKEYRPLVLMVRETPFSVIHLENMLRVAKAGGRIVPANPGFYHSPGSVMDLVDFVVGKALDSLGIEHDLFERWGSGKP